MSKYNPLEKYLEIKGNPRVPMTFSEIEGIIKDDLPPSARKYRAWWSNNPSNSVITYAWLGAGYKTAQVDLESEKLVFLRNDYGQLPPGGDRKIHPMFGCMKGLVTIPEELDLTEPADPNWGKRAYGDG